MPDRRFGAALSLHPVTAHAAGQVVGEVLERVGPEPDLAVVLVTTPHAGALEDVAAVVRRVLQPRVLVGCAAESVAANGTEVEDDAAVVLWAGRVGEVLPIHLTVMAGADGAILEGWPADPPFEPGALLLIADPFSFPAPPFFDALAELHPGLPVIGGNASAARGPGGNRLAIEDRVVTSGAVGVLLGARLETVVSQGCRPVGQPYAVTRVDGHVVHELGGQPALNRLAELDEHERALLTGGLLVGIAVDEHLLDFGPGDFLIRNLVGADRQTGAITLDQPVPLGTTLQFQVRDADTADAELRSLVAGLDGAGGLLFTCNGRGTRLFDEPHHDAAILSEALDRGPTAGFFAAGEFGPVGGRNFVHGHTAAIAVFP